MSSLGNFVWTIADQLRGPYKPHQYGGVILPFTILRRLDCILEPTRDQVQELAGKYEGGALDIQVKRKTGLAFYNTSRYDFARLLEDPEGLRANLIDYLTGFSSQIDVFERFKFEAEIATLDEKNRLYLIVSKFAEVDLHPDAVPNAEMGDLFEHLIRKFAEASNETAGEHYTPRDAIRLMVDLLFADDPETLLEPGTVRTVYDPTATPSTKGSGSTKPILTQRPMRPTSGERCFSCSPPRPPILTIATSDSGRAGDCPSRPDGGPPSPFPATLKPQPAPTSCFTGRSPKPRSGVRPRRPGSGTGPSSPKGGTPAFVWPADRTWCVAADIDPHWAGIGASVPAIKQLIADRRLDAVEADPTEEQPAYR